tara:strand:+ start:800 stop:910 length:111 start_codon:yes stop_codon:yes gene_type:complete
MDYTDPMQELLFLIKRASCSGAKENLEMGGNSPKEE